MVNWLIAEEILFQELQKLRQQMNGAQDIFVHRTSIVNC